MFLNLFTWVVPVPDLTFYCRWCVLSSAGFRLRVLLGLFLHLYSSKSYSKDPDLEGTDCLHIFIHSFVHLTNLINPNLPGTVGLTGTIKMNLLL